MELIVFLAVAIVVFLPILSAAFLLRDGAPTHQIIGQTMLFAAIMGGILQTLIGFRSHVPLVLLVFPIYLGANFIVLMAILGLRVLCQDEPQEQAIKRNEYEDLLLKYEEQ